MLDYKTMLEDCDDVARNRCGGKWHMPTYAQVKELIENTTAEPYTLDGVAGAHDDSPWIGRSVRPIWVP